MNERPRLTHLSWFAWLRVGVAILAQLMAGSARADETITVAATGSVVPMLEILADDFATQRSDLKIQVLRPPAGSSGAIKGVASGRVDIGVAARALKPGEATAKLEAVPWVSTAFVIAANHAGAPKGLTLAELAAIWSGATQRWPDGAPIRLLLRPPDDADIAALRAMSPEMNRAVDIALLRPGIPRAEHDLRNLEMLRSAPGAIGGSTLGLLLSSRSRLSMLAIDGVTPDVRSLQDGSYPYNRTLFLVSDRDTRASAFIAYLQSARARTLLERNGYIAAKR